jgi:hypothetical protein
MHRFHLSGNFLMDAANQSFGIVRTDSILSQDPDGLFARLVTGDESWFHYHTHEKKRQSMQWKHDGNPRPKKFRTASSAGKQTATVFWDKEGILMVELIPQGTTVNSQTSSHVFLSNDVLQSSVSESVRIIPKDWYAASIRKLPERRQRCTDLSGEYVECAEI